MEIFSRGGVGFATPPKSVPEMLGWHNEGVVFFKVVGVGEGLENGKVVGACAMGVRNQTVFFANQYVIPAFRGMRLGNAIIEELERKARAAGAKFAVGNVSPRFIMQLKRMWRLGYRPAFSLPKIKGKRHVKLI
ncbi:MAG: GNAT family N-acetyltransferase, partial [archaeon]